MKSTGIVRRIDDLGRVVIPKEIRRTFALREGDPLELFVSEEGIVFKKYVVGCIFCSNEATTEFNDISICHTCAEKIGKLPITAERR